MKITSFAPARIDIAGAWSDIPPFANRFGGSTFNIAINEGVEVIRIIGTYMPFGPEKAPSSIRSHGVQEIISQNIPIGSGLGASSSAIVAQTAAYLGKEITDQNQRLAIAKKAVCVEKAFGVVGGVQDQYAAAMGGFSLIDSSKRSISHSVIEVPENTQKAFQERLTLCYTGSQHISSHLHARVWGGLKSGYTEVINAISCMRDGVPLAISALQKQDWQLLGRCINHQHTLAGQLHPSLIEPVQELVVMVQPFVLGAKCCGAGGGGCMIFLSETPEMKEKLRQLLEEKSIQAINYQFRSEGVTVKKEV